LGWGIIAWFVVLVAVGAPAAADMNGEKSLYDAFESLFWMGWMPCTLIGASHGKLC
jgi:hypothetical protein